MNLTFEQWIALIALLIGLAGFVYKWNQGRAIRKVGVSFLSPYVIEVEFINARGHDVMIEEVGFECADGDSIVVPPADGICLPTEVWPERSSRYPFFLEQLRSVIQEEKTVPVRAYCKDATGQYYKTPLSREIRSALIG